MCWLGAKLPLTRYQEWHVYLSDRAGGFDVSSIEFKVRLCVRQLMVVD